jgi:hypothetical protein
MARRHPNPPLADLYERTAKKSKGASPVGVAPSIQTAVTIQILELKLRDHHLKSIGLTAQFLGRRR